MSDPTLNSTRLLFKELQKQYYTSWFRYHPEVGVDAGNEATAEMLRSYDEDDIGALLALNKKLVFALTEMNTETFDESSGLEYQLMLGAAEIEIHEQEESDWRYRNPNDYLPIHAIYQLLIHPVEKVHRALKRRLDLFPEHLRGAKVQLSQHPELVVPMWLESAVGQCTAGAALIRNLGRHPLIIKRFSNPARLQPVFDSAANALDDFSAFLKKEIAPHAAGDFACGSEQFNRLLNTKHFLGINHETLLQFGERLFEKTHEALLQQTKSMQGNEDVDALLKKIQKKQPKNTQLLERYRSQVREAFKWLSKSRLLTMPEKQSLKVQETPDFMRPMLPFAAYEPPSPNDPEQHGLYYVTTVTDEALMAEHNNFSIDLASAHEAFPGHHLQFVLSNQYHRGNFTRLTNVSASMYEGWALYCEELAIEKKLFNKKEHVFMMLRDRLWRALRIIIDVKIQTGQMTINQAVDLMVEKLRFEKSQAESELNWYSSAPTTPSCYAVGRELILSARKKCLDDGMELKAFHDALLKQGSIALPLVIHAAFGSDVWKHVHDDVFGDGK